MHHVTVGNDILLALQAQFANVARAGLALDLVAMRDGLGPDEAALESEWITPTACGARELRRIAGRDPARAHRGRIRPDGVPHQRAPLGDPQSRRNVGRLPPACAHRRQVVVSADPLVVPAKALGYLHVLGARQIDSRRHKVPSLQCLV